ncbi:hypothetical protein DFJ74DRAFT_678846 [Hyaloraphidium curvatum]|nr:hypothetical protein DFJ74DRAFT_678846 [Hyaloraphidium curvatum]
MPAGVAGSFDGADADGAAAVAAWAQGAAPLLFAHGPPADFSDDSNGEHRAGSHGAPFPNYTFRGGSGLPVPEFVPAPRDAPSPPPATPGTGTPSLPSADPALPVHVTIPVDATVALVRLFFRSHPRLRLLHERRVCRDFPPRQAVLSCLLLNAAGFLAQSLAKGDADAHALAHVPDPEGLETRLFEEATAEINVWLRADPSEKTPLDAADFLAAPLIMHEWAERRGLRDLAEKLEGVCGLAANSALSSPQDSTTASWEAVMCSSMRASTADEVREAPLDAGGVSALRDAWTAYHEFQGCLFALARIKAEAAARESMCKKRGDPAGLDGIVRHLRMLPTDATWRASFDDDFDPRFVDYTPALVFPLLSWIGAGPSPAALPSHLPTPGLPFLLLARLRLLLDALHASASASSLPSPARTASNSSTGPPGELRHSSFTPSLERRRRGLLASVRELRKLLAGRGKADEGARAVLAGAWMELETPCGEVFAEGRVHPGCVEGLAEEAAAAEGGGEMVKEVGSPRRRGRSHGPVLTPPDPSADPRSDFGAPQDVQGLAPPARPAARPAAALHLPVPPLGAPPPPCPRRPARRARHRAPPAGRVRVAAPGRRCGRGRGPVGGEGAGRGGAEGGGGGGGGGRRGDEEGGGGGAGGVVGVQVIGRGG